MATYAGESATVPMLLKFFKSTHHHEDGDEEDEGEHHSFVKTDPIRAIRMESTPLDPLSTKSSSRRFTTVLSANENDIEAQSDLLKSRQLVSSNDKDGIIKMVFVQRPHRDRIVFGHMESDCRAIITWRNRSG